MKAMLRSTAANLILLYELRRLESRPSESSCELLVTNNQISDLGLFLAKLREKKSTLVALLKGFQYIKFTFSVK